MALFALEGAVKLVFVFYLNLGANDTGESFSIITEYTQGLISELVIVAALADNITICASEVDESGWIIVDW